MTDFAEKIRKDTTQALADFQMIAPHDRVMVAISGGKDSAILLLTLAAIQQRAPFPFSLHPVMLDQKQPGFDAEKFCQWFADRGLPITVITEDTYSIVKDKVEPGKSYCGLCSRLRRGVLYNHAHAQNYQKIALGHHRDDLNQTVLMNLFYVGRMASMPPKLKADDERNTVIRPLCYIPEAWLTTYAAELQIPVIPCNLCGSQENLQRKKMQQLLRNLENDIPNIGASMITAQKNIRVSQLMDASLWDFNSL